MSVGTAVGPTGNRIGRRWYWYVAFGDFAHDGGFTYTRRGAQRAANRAAQPEGQRA